MTTNSTEFDAKYDAPIAALKGILMKDPSTPDKVSVLAYDLHGFRIAEISFGYKNGSGLAYMRCEHPTVIFAAEDFVITFWDNPFKPEGWESDIDFHAEATEALISELK